MTEKKLDKAYSKLVKGGKPKGPPTDVIDLDRLVKIFGLPTADDIQESSRDSSETYGYVHREAIEEGLTEEEAEEKAQEAEQEEQDEVFGKWHGAVMAVAEDLFGKHGLSLIERKHKGKKAKYPWEFKIVPEKSWTDAAGKIIETINGVGYFHYSGVKEFLDSGPYTAREAVLSHIGWINDYPKVYGDRSALDMYDRHMR